VKRFQFTIDRTALNIVSLVMGAVGIIGAFSGSNVSPSDANAGTFGTNLFAMKREIIAAEAAFGFAMLAAFMLLLQLVMEIFDWPKDDRDDRTWTYYLRVLVIAAILAWPICVALARTSEARARNHWRPMVISGKRESLEKARIVIESRGAMNGPGDTKPTTDEKMRSNRLKAEDNYLAEIEHLLEIQIPAGDLEARVKALSRIFEER
jgi:hypothetical protein